jgi:hypothetical protein
MLYRFFTIDREGHLHTAPEAHDMESDEAALRLAQRISLRHDIEVWEGRRLIGLVSHKKKCAAARNKIRA